ncbi:Probable inositol transporter 3 [Seminavis robusta]|uniref:Hexose transporter 1 n=1 Tax=Seminavis robusta TaxID=568900 RepID=A0A9N8EPL4_9STRA|nr:Probable inositol transporter 3 [Seminavis robusta]|eukprot:Sro1706_g292530.1 Probable inositol transporter 3 (699) ;mRNA; r:14454-16550
MSASMSMSLSDTGSESSLLDEERPFLVSCSTTSTSTTSSTRTNSPTMMTTTSCIISTTVAEDQEDAACSAAAQALLSRQLSVSHRMRVLTFFAAIGGFLSGYNTGVIAGALLPLKRVFDLSSEQEEAIVSATIVSACIASIVGGTLNTYHGRRGTLLLAAAIFTGGALLLWTAQNYTCILIGEILLGIGIGLESLTSPLYIAEVAKPSMRGKLVSAYALMMCMGQFVAGIMDGVYAHLLPDGWAWRAMFGTAMVPGIVMFTGFLGLPESPSWLMMASTSTNNTSCSMEQQAFTILQSVRDTDQEVELELQSLRQTARHVTTTQDNNTPINHKTSILTSFTQMTRDVATRNALLVGCGLMILQQICGVNGVLYYAASVYEMAGFDELTSIWLSAFTAFAQIIGLALAVVLIETAGRRVLVLASLCGIGLASLGLGYSFYAARIYSPSTLYIDPACAAQPALVWDGITRNCWDCTSIPGCGFCGNACVQGTPDGPLFLTSSESQFSCPADTDWSYNVCENPYGYLSVVFMVVYLIVFGMGMAGLPWTVNSEIYPVRFRSLAVSFSTGTNWLSNLLVSSTFLTINSPAVLTSYGSFYLYATLCFVGAATMYVYLPETKGLSMAQIEVAFEHLGSNTNTTTHATTITGEQAPLLSSHKYDIDPQTGAFGTCKSSSYGTSSKQGDATVQTCDSSDAETPPEPL